MHELVLILNLEEASATQARDLWTALATLKDLTNLFIKSSEPDIDFLQHLSLLKDLRYDSPI